MFCDSRLIFRKLFVISITIILFSNKGFSSVPIDKDTIAKAIFPGTTMPKRDMPSDDWWSVLWPEPKEILRSLKIESDMTVLDLCCGDGHFAIPLAQMAAKVYGLDLEMMLLKKAQEST